MIDSDAEYIDNVKARYGFDGWPGRERISALPRRRFALRVDALEGFTHEERVAIPGGRVSYTDYLRAPEEGLRLAVTVTDYDSALGAHEGLVFLLANCMAIQVPRAAEKGLDVGDVSFCGEVDSVIESVYFVRDSILVRIDNVGPRFVSVAPVARAIDEQIMTRAAEPRDEYAV